MAELLRQFIQPSFPAVQFDVFESLVIDPCRSAVGVAAFVRRCIHWRYVLHAHLLTNLTLYTESSDCWVTFPAASIVTGWSEPVPGRELHPLKSSAFQAARFRQLAATDVSGPVRLPPGLSDS